MTNFLPDYRSDSQRTTVSEVFHFYADGEYQVDPPYQRDSVWTDEQRVRFVRSLRMGLPTGAIWLHANDARADADLPYYTVVDGRQRIETIAAWFTDGIAVPAWWFNLRPEEAARDFPPNLPDNHSDTVVYSDLTDVGQRGCKHNWQFNQLVVKGLTTAEQADLFVVVNEGGTFQTADDMDRARTLAAGELL